MWLLSSLCSKTTIPETLLHGTAHVTHVRLTQICSALSSGDKHQSPEEGNSRNKKYESLQSGKSAVISSKQRET